MKHLHPWFLGIVFRDCAGSEWAYLLNGTDNAQINVLIQCFDEGIQFEAG